MARFCKFFWWSNIWCCKWKYLRTILTIYYFLTSLGRAEELCCERILLFRIFTQNYEWHDSKPGIRIFQTLKVNLNFGEGKFGWMTLWHIIQVSATHRVNQSKLGRIMIVHNLEYDGVCSSQVLLLQHQSFNLACQVTITWQCLPEWLRVVTLG